MSQVPTSAGKLSAEHGFRQGLAAVNELQRRGLSWSGYERNCFFLNTGGRRFTDISAVSGFDFLDDARAIACVDWDADGALDLWVTNRTGPRVRLLRNNLNNDHAWIAVRLEGTKSNRDAIGARLAVRAGATELSELASSRIRSRKTSGRVDDGSPQGLATPAAQEGHAPPRRVQTLRAGSGYLGQSSKWVHFGLETMQANVDVEVRWPDGQTERFPGLAPNRRYHIRQGGAASRVPARKLVALAAIKLPEPNADSASQTFLPLPIPLPNLRYQTATGEQRTVARPGQLVLLNLWSLSCQPCLAELKEWTDHRESLSQARVDVVAVNVDQLEKSPNSVAMADADKWLDQVAFAFRRGHATAELMKTIELLQLHLFDSQRPLPVPCSLLMNEHGALVAWYRGRVDTQRLLDDVATLSLDKSARVTQAVPFAGRWRAMLDRTNVAAVARLFRRTGNAADAASVYSCALRCDPDDVQLHIEYADLLVGQNNRTKAAHHLGLATQLSPGNANAWTRLGKLMVSQDARVAANHFRRAIAADGKNAEAHFHLGRLLLSQGDSEEAKRLLNAAVKLRPSDVPARINLAMALDQCGDFGGAVQRLEQALKLDPEAVYAQNNLAWLLATCPDPKFRDRGRALQLARATAKSTNYQDANVLDTLAAALASNDEFEKAVKVIQRCLELAPKSQHEEFRHRIDRYREGKRDWESEQGPS